MRTAGIDLDVSKSVVSMISVDNMEMIFGVDLQRSFQIVRSDIFLDEIAVPPGFNVTYVVNTIIITGQKCDVRSTK